MHYIIQWSNHPEAGLRIPTPAATESWQTVYDGTVASPQEARKAADDLSSFYRHVRVFKGKHVGKLWYGVLR